MIWLCWQLGALLMLMVGIVRERGICIRERIGIMADGAQVGPFMQGYFVPLYCLEPMAADMAWWIHCMLSF